MMIFDASLGVDAAIVGSFVCGFLATYEATAKARPPAARINAIVQTASVARRRQARAAAGSRTSSDGASSIKQRLVARFKLQSSKEAAAGRLLLSRAGALSDRALTTYLLMRVSLPALFGGVALLDGLFFHLLPLVSHAPTLAAIAATLLGSYCPTLILKNKITRRQGELRKSLPDGIDLLVICVESGASINESFARVGRELARGHAALAEEFAITAAELSFLSVRRTALENLLERTGLPAIRGLVTTMLQSERFGTPIAQALRVLSAEFRDQRMMAAETKAAKLPVLLTVPMMIFILPVLFIVLLGPAALHIMDAMAK